MNINLIKSLDFGRKINAQEAITESGKKCLHNYRGYVYSNPVNYTLVNSFINEAKQYTYDDGLCAIVESVLSFVNSNKVSWTLASTCESIMSNTSSYNAIARSGVNKVSNLLEMSESDLVSSIKAGALNDVQYIPEFRGLWNVLPSDTNVNENIRSEKYTVSTPVSYLEESENDGYTLFSIDGIVYEMETQSKDVRMYTGTPSETFTKLNESLSKYYPTGETLVHKCTLGPSNVWQFTVSESCITVDHNSTHKVFESVNGFMEFMETCAMLYTSDMKNSVMESAISVSEVFGAMDNIALVDTAKVINTRDSVATIIEGSNGILYRIEDFDVKVSDSISEALKDVEYILHVNISDVYEDAVSEVTESEDKNLIKYIQVREDYDSVKSSRINARFNKIQQLAESLKDDPAAIALLNSISKDLAEIESK